MTGWTWDQVRQLDMNRVDALRAAWKDNPPLTVTMRAVAEANGVQFKSGALLGKADSHSAPTVPEMPDPSAIMAELGQTEVVKYVPPRRGVIPAEEQAPVESTLAPGEDCA
jgi:hypothetical protein